MLRLLLSIACWIISDTHASYLTIIMQVLSKGDPPRKTYVYKLNAPVSAGWISLAVAPFEILPDRHTSIISHLCLSPTLTKLENTVGFFHQAFRCELFVKKCYFPALWFPNGNFFYIIFGLFHLFI